MTDQKPKENSEKKSEIEEVKTEIIVPDEKSDDAIILEPQKLDVKKGGNIIIGTLNVFTDPAKKRWQKHYHPKNRNWHIHLIIDVILGAVILALIAANIFILTGAEMGISRKVEISIQLEPTDIVSGENLSYVIDYKNNSKTKLNNAKLTINFPQEFVLNETIPSTIFTDHTNTFDLGEIDSGGNGQLKLIGIIWGEVGSQQKITATLNFQPENSALRKQKTVGASYNITDSRVSVELELPDKISNGQKIDGLIKYKNDSDFDIEEVIIMSNLKDNNFNFEFSAPALTGDLWTIKNLKANSEGQINFSGRFVADKNINQIENKISLKISLNGNELIQDQTSQNTEIVHSKLNLNLKSNETMINLGEEVIYQINYENKENFDLENVIITINFNLALANGENKVIFTKVNTPQLAKIAQGQVGEIELKIKTSTSIEQLTTSDKNLNLLSFAQATYTRPDDSNLEIFGFSQRLSQKINTDLNLKAFVRYYTDEGDQLGLGPLPPVVDSATKYWIFFNIKNNYNDTENILVTANLSDNVLWTEQISTTQDQAINFNPNNKQISWEIAKVVAPSDFFPSVGAAFEVELTPTENQVGQTANLIENIQISGTDNFTGQQITEIINNITTDLSDGRSGDSGLVQSE